MRYVNTPRKTKPADMKPEMRLKAWGIFDWMNRKEYPENNDSLTADQWRWEFLRRTTQYRRDYLQTTNEDKAVSHSKYFDYAMTEFIDPRLSYTKLPKSFRFERYPLIMRSDRGSYSPTFPDIEIEEDFSFAIDQEKEFTVDVRFDLRRGIVLQCEDAKNLLQNLQKIKKRKEGLRDLPRALRVLDAYEATRDKTVIANELFNSDKKECARILRSAHLLWKRL